MVGTGSSYLFSLSFLQQLSRDLNQPNFVPNNTQKVVIEHALRLLDWELSRQADEHVDLNEGVKQWLESTEE